MRGKVLEAELVLDGDGITPAHAGKRSTASATTSQNRDHPRMCGEKGLPTLRYSPQSGSPPHVRGKGWFIKRAARATRITPACAGKSFIVLSEGMIFRDYPRVCGEKRRHTDGVGVAKGSPPHMRGKAGSRKQGKRAAGITPACAGKSPEESGGRPGQRDHPRMCGEKRETALSFNFVQGSPPHMRGKVCCVLGDLRARRITPAYAGKSLLRRI